MASRGRTRRRAKSLGAKKLGDLATMLVVGFVVYAVYRDQLNPAVWVLLAIATFGIWWLFLMPTHCDTILRTDPTKLCTSHVRGKIRGCHPHRHERDKLDAVFDLLNMRNPGMLFRVGWRAPDYVPRSAPAQKTPAQKTPAQKTPAQTTATVNAARDTWMLIFTIVSALAGVAGAAFTAIF